ncbi:MAG: heparan-alpha-glucosaminide N-acetyltransferase domain-containing protein [Bryobacter sp.]|nr:heparan-alpha-glucosaminide N-acetyltransferase domain-containing protein [Bryobacter sp.]
MPPLQSPPRQLSLDLLRGIVIALMALDHVRDFFSASAGLFEPTNLARTTPQLFFTRWITHLCAPTFVLLAGIGAYLSTTRGRSLPQLSRFLATRGLWLIFLEVAFITPFGWSFQANPSFFRLQVIWAIGCSFLCLAALLPLPTRAIGLLGLCLVAGHNLFDSLLPLPAFLQPLWSLLHSVQFFRLNDHQVVASLYPLLPWLGLLLLGFGLGELWQLETPRRGKFLLAAAASCLLFLLLFRLPNLYGDPQPWTAQSTPLFTLLSFLNVSKYPPSASFLAITLAPAFLLLFLLERQSRPRFDFFLVFGRVPLFFYLLHLPVIHGLAVLFSEWQWSGSAWLWQDPFALRRPPLAAPPGYGYSLPVVYGVWLFTLVALYPICRWYGQWKARSRNPLLSYL